MTTTSAPATESTDPTPARPVDAYPMTSLQAGMLYHSSLHTGSATYHDQVTLELTDGLDEQALRTAAAEVVAAHAVLRTSFDLQRFSEPMQLVWDHVEVPIEVIDLAGRDPVVARAGIRRRLEEERTAGFDWARPPLLRLLAYRMPRSGSTLVTLTFHHAILDGWSLSLLLDELMRRYRAACKGERLDLPAPRGSFREVVALERQAEANPESQKYWNDVLDDAPVCRLPRHATAERTEEVAAVRETLPADVVEGLTELARAASVPLRTVFLAVHLRLVALWSGTREAVSGVLTHNRTELEDSDRILGLFLAALPLRVDVSLDDSWRSLVQRVFQAELDLMPHRGVPLATIQRWVGRGDLYDVLFDFRRFGTYHDTDDGLPSLGVDDVEGFEQTNLPLAVNMIASPKEIVLEARYDSAQFLPEEIEALLETYRAALRSCATTPDADPRPTAPLGVVGGVSVGDGGVVDVGGLGEVVGRVWEPARAGLAGRLRASGVGVSGSAECVVGVLMERGPGLVEAVHAVVGAGGVYVPLEPSFPDEHLGFLLTDVGCGVVVTEPGSESRVRGLVEQFCPGAAVVVHAAGEVVGVVEPVVEPSVVGGDGLAYVIHTSGSTGRPKGVGVSHRAVANRLWWMRDLVGITASDRVLLKTPFSFDVSVWELFLPAYVGAVQVVAGPGVHRDSAALVELIATERVSVVHFVPSMLDAFLAEPALTNASEQERRARWGGLRVVVCSGEALTPALVARVAELLPWVEVVNLYGPTEAAVDVTWHRTEVGAPSVPIGVAVPHTRIEVLDEALQRVPAGVAGELCIAGVQVARGYVGRPGLTARSFVPDPFGPAGARMYRTGDRARIAIDGAGVETVEFLGRSDGQVKVRGVRVELGEVRAGLERDPWVRAAWVVHRAGGDGGSLTGYLVPDETADLEVGQVRSPQVWRDHLGERLPAHMVPTRVVELAELPVTVNGKLDTAALAELETTTVDNLTEGVAPQTLTEVAVAEIWADLLEPGRALSVADNFFDLGGHSILALRMAAALRTRLDVEVPIATLLSAPTVGQFAAELDRGIEGTREDRIVPLRRTGSRPPLIFMHALGGQIFRYEPVAKHLGDDQPVWAIPAAGITKGVDPETDLDTMAKDYAALIREAVPSDEYVVGGFCIGGNIAMEVARHLTASGATVHAVLPVWSSIDEPVARASLEDDVVMMNHALAGGFADVEPCDLIGLSPEEQLLAVVKGAADNNALQTTSTDIEEIRGYLDVFRANAHAVGHYTHASWPGRVVLFLPEDDEHIDLSNDQGWSGVAPDTAVQAIPGTRHTAVQEPTVIGLAALMRQRIDEAIARHHTAEPSNEENA